MASNSKIELSSDLATGVERIKDPSEVVWKSVLAALVASTFFWGSPGATILGITIGLPAILTVCGGVGGVVFLTLGASGTLCAYKLLMAAKKTDVLTRLRNQYTLNENTLSHI